MKSLRILAATAAVIGLAACNSDPKTPPPSPSGKSASLRSMEQVAIAAHKCWFASKDPAFKKYQMANELNNFGGTPRFLLVPAKQYGARPLLVVQAQGNSSQVQVFGPLMSEALGARIGSDINRWRSGDASCGAAA
ncbi:hypothetical protein EDC40_105200 [Aminobacter aminovorans]|jgi:hypothetical protein|uniref:Lipoprotein n=1 Tax=Aminobacter aminovorans TaxID=83263 RepID=A0A380WNI3_AMIAI|nr:hypothetical protein [Aminobacter aminovorans]TCS26000.1 hypothetical protein EDC40_105200 [Aminobacter aminovorans]SUU90335.1 Uncharacterised protein [Aminobacter aminovorans]